MSKFTAEKLHVNIRQHRVAAGLSQEKVSSALGMSQNAYSRIELGYANVSVERWLQISEVLKCDPLVLIQNKS